MNTMFSGLEVILGASFRAPNSNKSILPHTNNVEFLD